MFQMHHAKYFISFTTIPTVIWDKFQMDVTKETNFDKFEAWLQWGQLNLALPLLLSFLSSLPVTTDYQ